MKPYVTIFTLAYNAESYIRETIESVLNQDEPNFEYIIRDNGSTDGTYDIIKEYAEKDARIKILRNKDNMRNEDGTEFLLRDYCPNPTGEYFSWLDSDDLIKSNYVSKAYQCAKENNADIVIVGTQMFEEDNRSIFADRLPGEFVLRSGEKMKTRDFIDTYGMIRVLWGKIFRTDFFFGEIDEIQRGWDITGVKNGGDTIISLLYLAKAECTVSIREQLHFYRVRKQSYYRARKPEIERIREGERLFITATEILPKLGMTFVEAGAFLYMVYFCHLRDLLAMCLQSDCMLEEEQYRFCEAVLNNDLMMTFPNEAEVLQCWKENVEKVILQVAIKKEFQYRSEYDSFLRDIAVFFTPSGILPQSIKDLYLVQGVFSEENKYFYGSSFFAAVKKRGISWCTGFLEWPLVKQKSIVASKEVLKEFIQYSVGGDCDPLKVEMLEVYDNGELQEALVKAKQILEGNPIDPEAIYFGIVLAFELRQEMLLSVLIDLQKKYWPNHEELRLLVAQIDAK